MKRAAILLCLLLLTGCGSDAVPAIEEEAWQKNHNEPEMPSSVFVDLVGRPRSRRTSRWHSCVP